MLWGYILLLLHIWCHELGHYTAGRFLVGIPKENIKIQLSKYPAHVAIKNRNNSFIKPGDEKFIETYFNYDPKGEKSFFFIMAGFFLQSFIFFISASIFYYFFNNVTIAYFVIIGSFIMNSVYIFGDIIMSLLKRTPLGDTSSSFQFAPVKTILFTISLLLIHILFYLYLTI